jgi:hypothetical protein
MSKFFYTDPLAAAWMDIHFGMRFLDARGNDIWFQPINSSFGYFLNREKPVQLQFVSKGNEERASFLHPELTFKPLDRAYIHPDSLHVLEPQEADPGRPLPPPPPHPLFRAG